MDYSMKSFTILPLQGDAPKFHEEILLRQREEEEEEGVPRMFVSLYRTATLP